MSPAPKAPSLTPLINQAMGGDREAERQLSLAVLAELRAIAGARFACQPRGHLLQPTALVNEAWIRLFPGEANETRSFVDRGRFFAYVSKVMRNVLLDYAKESGRQKRGGGLRIEPLNEEIVDRESSSIDQVLDLIERLEQLAVRDELAATVAQFHLMLEWSLERIAETLQTPLAVVKRHWQLAKAYLADGPS